MFSRIKRQKVLLTAHIQRAKNVSLKLAPKSTVICSERWQRVTEQLTNSVLRATESPEISSAVSGEMSPGTAARCNLHDQNCPVPLDRWRRLSHDGAVVKLEIQILCPR